MNDSAALNLTQQYSLRLADDALVLGQQLSLWITRAPQIEEELAIANMALDLLGQARPLLRAVGDEDELAFDRDVEDFTNLLIVEQPNGDFAATMVRQLLFSAFQLARYEALATHADAIVAGVAAKAVKEGAYHLDHAQQWVVRLGDGTEVSHARAQAALDELWPYVDEMFEADDVDLAAGVDPRTFRSAWGSAVDEILTRATLSPPAAASAQTGGRRGRHTPHLRDLLTDMRSVRQAYPGASW
ncbi:phenylacetic acid degradation protein [Microbacterium sp. Leaf288]|uniref:1,2-phenylacetyl-CoA epoxidase subunit PaaC n=1 Tax=Microbacterium sp. Leaf288 TaxID=1736323 RepID=UPI0006FB2316|nr:1,2-phenylacetyl-CoA epoxidase subunit PaaC [Microbacterium sp. Leaf288]KQP69991.1 phenylacetic acid degradation protein [Microbacterium sp. Leaf288]